LTVKTKDAPYAGTGDLVQAIFKRDGERLGTFDLAKPGVDDHERGDERNYDFEGASNLPRRTDETLELQPGVQSDPMPYPPYGFEFSNDLEGHLVIRLQTDGDNMWIKDNVDFYIKQFRVVETASGAEDWRVDISWHYIKSWDRDVSISLDDDDAPVVLQVYDMPV
jgi:hypothetical protein